MSIARPLAAARRLLFLAAIAGSALACGALVGVKDLSVDAGEDTVTTVPPDSGAPDVQAQPDTSSLAELDSSIDVDPPREAGCVPRVFGSFPPTGFVVKGAGGNVMKWTTGTDGAQVPNDGKSFTCSSAAFADGPTVCELVKFENFKTNIPANETIVGLAVKLRARSSRNDLFADNLVELRDITGNIRSANHIVEHPGTWTTETEDRRYGSSETLWELEDHLRPEFVNAETFGVVYQVKRLFNDPDEAYYLDHVELTVYVCAK